MQAARCGPEVVTQTFVAFLVSLGAGAFEGRAFGGLAVGDPNVPEQVDGCDQHDNVEQEGEH
jgi:hypothetical protein